MAYYDLDMNSKRIISCQDPVSAQDLATKNYLDTYIMKQIKVERFTANGTFTAPAGSSYAIAHIRAGGGAVGRLFQGSPGVNSSVAFPAPVGTITATGGSGSYNPGNFNQYGVAGRANSGHGAKMYCSLNADTDNVYTEAQDGAEIVAGSAIVPGNSYAVVVGSGGTAPAGFNADGGSGYVWIEYY